MIYDESQDIVSFIREREERNTEPRFRGSEQYKMLWDGNLFLPKQTWVQVFSTNSYGHDFEYQALNREQLQGLGMQRIYLISPEGIFSVEDVLDKKDTHFQVSEFNLN